jgi:hypothetical protein
MTTYLSLLVLVHHCDGSLVLVPSKLNSFNDELKNNNKKKVSWLQKFDMSMPEFYLCGKTFGG